jgi:exodeoxyribonuclease V alpha subunit
VGRPGQYRPLILDARSRLYLYRYWEYEKTLADHLKARAAAWIHEPDRAGLGSGLSKLFPDTGDGQIDWQKVAALVCTLKPLCVITGGPGTGKSTVVAKILALLLSCEREMRLALTAPTGKAAARLEQAVHLGNRMLPATDQIDEDILTGASTIHRLLGTIPGSPYFRHDSQNPLPVDLVVVDEASMVDLALMCKLIQAVPSTARLLILGDKDQLASVEAGAVLGDICDTGHRRGFSSAFARDFLHMDGMGIEVPHRDRGNSAMGDCVVNLEKNYRFGSASGIGCIARSVNSGKGDLALQQLQGGEFDDIGWHPLPAPSGLKEALRGPILRGYGAYLKTADPLEAFQRLEQFRILCALRRGPYGVAALNRLAEQVLTEADLIRPVGRWYGGQPLLIAINDYALGLFNGDTGIVLPDPQSNNELRAFFLSPEGTIRKFLPIRLPAHETVYAVTVHKSQGSEFDRVELILPDAHSPVLTRELIYTGITRARQRASIWARPDVFVEAVGCRIGRSSGLRDALWGEPAAAMSG